MAQGLLAPSSPFFTFASSAAPPLLELAAWKPLHFSQPLSAAGGPARIWRQEGQEEWDRSQVSMHATWKAWPHCGRTRISSPAASSARQMAQSEKPASEPGARVSFGSDRRTFFLRPLLALGWDGFGGERRRSQAQRATATRPSKHIRAQSRTASIRTDSEPAASIPSVLSSDVVAGESPEPRNLKGRVMRGQRETLSGGVSC